ncbi:UDP-N-acetylglucosamine 2-epimerase (non-hydrolyzing) [Neobacillus sp. MER 74]|uniref:non-hydrolyzing UDP-N-acetylglucosamine 2-epimerase n=1 Tax=Neobacillus sp. MER 74 TaxID=2939566 RepID=UPI00203D7DA1|nr:UDP-N-acetylglucosamine 2-epimerase (non-hydrolyzing) [Neobacillus sp. MER 74]MCM3117094.1 UDP-N-acetylglucosamine 2-epimerase (non-hydrolyzing) [Neobacillus sp. MER 74]
MKVMTILGTRPEIIRLSLIIQKLDALTNHFLVHTGQNYDRSLSDVFFEQLRIRQPNYKISLNSNTFGQQVGYMFSEMEKIITKEKPDKILLLGDTNSGLCALLGERMGIPVFHMEAGNRCFDMSVPEEINRKAIDSISTYNLPYTMFSRENLIREGVPNHRIWVSGNPIYEVLQHYMQEIDKSDILTKLNITANGYIVVTAHRAENVDNETRLRHIVDALQFIAKQHQIPIICSVHPRTRDRMQKFAIDTQEPLIHFSQPFGFFDFVHLQKHARCVITDSGTVQEESCILGVPSVTIRNSTERPETVICGSNVISGVHSKTILDSVNLMIQSGRSWKLPEGYDDPNVSSKVVNMVLGGLHHVKS